MIHIHKIFSLHKLFENSIRTGAMDGINNLIAAFRQLSVMTNAGISIHNSIKEVSKSTEDKRLKAIFATLNDDLNQGQSLTDAITKFKGELDRDRKSVV